MTSKNYPLKPNIWIPTTWDKYLETLDQLKQDKSIIYYYNGRMKLEMTPIGSDHASDHSIIIYAVNLYATLKNIELTGKDNCSYRKKGYVEAQPDISFYLGKNADIIPYGTSIISLDKYPAPDLVIEISKTTLADDQGEKRFLYEDLGVKEYWIVDVKNAHLTALAIENKGSYRIEISQVLENLDFSILNTALKKTREMNHGKVGRWLLEQFS